VEPSGASSAQTKQDPETLWQKLEIPDYSTFILKGISDYKLRYFSVTVGCKVKIDLKFDIHFP